MRFPVRRAFILTLAIAVPAAMAAAGKLALRYGLDRRVYYVCNLLVPPNYVNANPYFFIALEHSPMKPPGWEFENPLAVPFVQDRPGTALDMFDQWQNAGHAPDAGSGPNYWSSRGLGAGSPINKSWPQYWEVYFDGYVAERLRDYDLIYISGTAIDLASATLRRALIDAVREGATLWIDSGGGYTTVVSNLEPPQVDNPGGARVPFTFVNPGAGNYYRVAVDSAHDIFNSPFRLTPGEIYVIGDRPQPGAACDGQYIDLAARTGPLDQVLIPILGTAVYGSGNPPTPSIALCTYGAGRIIVTANGIGEDVEEWLRAGATRPDAYQAPDVKLAYNVLAWGTGWEAPRQASSNLGYTNASCLPPLDIVWQYPRPDADPIAEGIGPVISAPVVSHGCVYVVSLIGAQGQPARVMCFDADPQRDIDGDGLADDGVQDYAAGAPYDMIWSADLNSVMGVNDATPHGAGVSVGYMPHDGRLVVVCAAVSNSGATPDGMVAALDAMTGQPVWVFHAMPFRPGAEVRDISTPVIHGGWVFFLCSEFDNARDGNPGAASADDTYGRAWCIDLQTGGGSIAPPAGYASHAVWCYPDPDLDDNGVADPTDTEYQGVLLWHSAGGRPLQLPPDPGVIPTITTYTRVADDTFTEAVITVGTPVRMGWDAPGGVSRIARGDLSQPFNRDGVPNVRFGGMDLTLIPTPGRNDGGVMQYFLNANYYRIYVANNVTSVAQVKRQDDPNIATTEAYPFNPGASTIIVIPPHAARYLLAATSASINSPLALPTGVNLLVDYNDGANNITDELRWLRGIIPWQSFYGARERRVTPPAVRDRKLYAVTSIPDPDDNPLPPGTTSRIVSQDLRTNAREWQFDPIVALPALVPVTSPQARCEGAAAVGHDTVVAAMGVTPMDPSANPGQWAAVFGTRTVPVLTISLPGSQTGWGVARGVQNPNDSNADHRRPVTVKKFLRGATWTLGVVDPWHYEVDYDEAALEMRWESAYRITVDGGNWAGHIYGEPLLITWLSDNGTPDDPSDDQWLDDRLYVVPPLTRFAYVPGFIQLHYYPVIASSVVITTQEGLPVRGAVPGEPTFPYDLDGNGTADDILPHGWIDLRGAYVDVNNNASHDPGEPVLKPGTVLDVSYVGFHNDWGAVPIPNAALNIPAERHQAPVGFGPSRSGVAMAGSVVHVGTEGFDPNGDGVFDVPWGGSSTQETLLSLLWEPASGLVRGWLARPANPGNFDPSGNAIPAASGLPAVSTDGLFIGSLLRTSPVAYQDTGFVSHLRTRHTLIADASRVIRCAGQDVEWELTGTQSWEYGQAATDRPTPLPLNHPAKVASVGGGNLLIVDTGNDRVVEVDSSGNVIWPLDGDGYNYYSSPANANLHLRRPGDAQRFYSLRDMDGDGTREQVTNTVVADTGNGRVLHIRTWWAWNGAAGRWEQRHSVERVTPEYLRDPTDPTRRVRARYTNVAIITDPITAELAGYLCAAANLNQLVVVGYVNGQLVVNPPANAPMPGGATWAVWAWLYDPDVSDANHVRNDPLIFAGIRNMSLTRWGKIWYLDVCCAQYRGRLSRWSPQQPSFYVPDPGAGVFEFRVLYDGPSSGLIPGEEPAGTPNSDAPIWRFSQLEYSSMRDSATGIYYFRIPLPDGTTYNKPFLPTSCQVLPDGKHLISSNSGLVERLTKAAIRQTGVVCTPEVFEVATDPGTNPSYALDDAHAVDARAIIPDPYGPDWRDPLVLPAYAERVLR
ncbi:MAG: hypothetical protein H5T86_00950 [Armatimonadetes bacterium]|nr:hypothetical protein [Armatimonadota bacterium]